MAQVQQAPVTSLVTVTMPELNHVSHAKVVQVPELNAMQKMMRDGFLKGGAELLRLVNTRGEHNIFPKDGKLLKIVIEHLVAEQKEGKKGKKNAPTTAQCRALLKDANHHFLCELTGDTERPNKTLIDYSGDAATLQKAWSMALKLAKQNFRRSQNKKKKSRWKPARSARTPSP